MHNDLLNFLKSHKVFSSLNEDVIAQLQKKLIRVDLNFNDILFEHGEISEAVYFLIRGKLKASITTVDDQTKIVGYIDEGEIIGELAALANEPYPYTVTALRHCIIYKLLIKDFLELCHQNPSCMLQAIQPLISHSNNIIQLLSVDHTHNCIAIIPANKNVAMEDFARKLTSLLRLDPNIVLFSDYNDDDKNLDLHELHKKINHMEQYKHSSQQIIYILKSSYTPLAKITLDKADKFYLVANAAPKAHIDAVMLEHMRRNTINTKALPNLIIIHPETTDMPKHTNDWLKKTSFNMHHHVRIDKTKHYERLIRFFQDKANGLILGGGGTRGWGHIGVIKALCEQQHPIDFIGGTSVGAIIGGCYAMNESYEDTYSKFNVIVSTSKHSISWRSVTLPIISIFDAKSFTNANVQVFENNLIEDLWLPYFCISSNLTNYTEEVHKSGLLWEKIRASSSIPGLIPPMVMNGDIHFDGGLLNNLPVDIMWKFIGNKGKTIGVELNSSMHDTHKYHFPPIVGFKQAITAKMGNNRRIYKFPRFVDIFLRGLLVGSSTKAKQNGQSATILINLSLNKFSLLKFSHKQAQNMIEIGFSETMLQLHQYENRNF